MLGRFVFVALAILINAESSAQTWREAVLLRKAKLELYWNTSEPFIFRDENGDLKGVEYENILLFQRFLFENYSIDLELEWIEIEAFDQILDTIKHSSSSNRFGVSAFSITPDRETYLKFTNSYLSDIVVFVSSKDTPIVKTAKEVNDLLASQTAITIKSTIYENLLYDLRERLKVTFDIRFIESYESVVAYIGNHDNCFGFIDLPIYLNLLRNGKGNSVTRQNLFTIQGAGYGYIMPKKSQWKIPFDEFLGNPKYKKQLANIISKYFGKEYLQFIDQHYSSDELDKSILTEEKELQHALIENANLKLEKEEIIRELLIWGVVAVSLLLMIIGFLFVGNKRFVQMLIQKKNQIEIQRENIKEQNKKLTTQNEQLVSLNEEKNNLVKILAHDMRAPLGQIIGVITLLKDPDNLLSEDQKKMFLETVESGAKKTDEMIKRILDVDVLEKKKKLVTLDNVDVNKALCEIEDRYKLIAKEKKIQLMIEPLAEGRMIISDRMLVCLIIENLISNAIKFSLAETTVRVLADDFGDYIHFSVQDQGPGFTQEDKSLVFNRFQRLSARPTGDEHSIGLGLSIVKKYVNDLGGEIWLESEEGIGSTFFVSIPDKKSVTERYSLVI